jgi:hypothetical protein
VRFTHNFDIGGPFGTHRLVALFKNFHCGAERRPHQHAVEEERRYAPQEGIIPLATKGKRRYAPLFAVEPTEL